METLYVTNTPVVFQIAWRIIKPMLPASSPWQVHLCGGARDLPKMIGAGCPLSSIPSWISVPKQKLRASTRALLWRTACAPSSRYFIITAGDAAAPPSDDDGDVLDGAGSTILKRGFVCKRGRRTNADPNTSS